jgi:hypothetical protein
MGGNQEELLEWYKLKFLVKRLVTCYVVALFLRKYDSFLLKIAFIHNHYCGWVGI